jgi:DNA-binding MarR family transcriptional regulator
MLRKNSSQPSASPTPEHQSHLIQDVFVLLDDGDRRVLGMFGLSPTQYRLLLLLDREQGQRITTLSERLLLAKSTITRIVDQLEQMGWVRRMDDVSDRRAQDVILTRQGLENRERISAAYLHSLQQRLNILSQTEQQTLDLLLDKLRAGLQNGLSAT